MSRKKLGQMPPAYTQIDYSHDSIESNRKYSLKKQKIFCILLEACSRVASGPVVNQPHPLITVEDANSLVLPKRSFSSILIDSQKSSLERATALNENGALLLSSQNNSQNSATLCPSTANPSLGQNLAAEFKRNNSR